MDTLWSFAFQKLMDQHFRKVLIASYKEPREAHVLLKAASFSVPEKSSHFRECFLPIIAICVLVEVMYS